MVGLLAGVVGGLERGPAHGVGGGGAVDGDLRSVPVCEPVLPMRRNPVGMRAAVVASRLWSSPPLRTHFHGSSCRTSAACWSISSGAMLSFSMSMLTPEDVAMWLRSE